MALIKISALTTLASAGNTDVFPIVLEVLETEV